MINKILLISYGTGGAECLNLIFNKLKSINLIVENISISPYTKGKLDNSISLKENEILDYINKSNATLVINERSSGLDLQNEITKHCIDNNIFNISILDVGGGYINRFRHMPNIICVPSDKIKREMTSLGFDSSKLYVTGNPTFDLLPCYNKPRKFDNVDILFASQPLLKYNVANEFDIFKDYYDSLETNFNKFSLKVKLHPQDDIELWKEFLTNYNNVSIVNELLYDNYDLIIGYDSTVMLRSSAMNIPTIFYSDKENQILNYINNLEVNKIEDRFKPNALDNICKVISDILTNTDN